MSHQTAIKVRGYHLDVYQHVNNARYLEFLEEARWGYLESTGDLAFLESMGLAWVIVNININYRAAATMGQTLLIDTILSRLGSKSAVFHQTIMDQASNRCIADADITFVIMDPKIQKSIEIDGELKARLAKYLPA